MKKHLLFIFVMLLPLLASAQTKVEIDGIWYNLDAGTKQAEVTYKGSSYDEYTNEYSGSITLPATVTHEGVDYSVTSIGNYAFRGCSSLTAITLPEGVTSIGSSAFSGCRSLTSIILPEGVTSIGSSAFSGCRSLTSIILPEGVTSIGSSAFSGCSSLTAITIPDSVTSIGNYAFEDCSSLTAITIPDSVTSIGNYAFEDCSSLTAVHISDIAAWCNIKFSSSSSNPLYYAHNLYLNGELVTELTLPDSVTSIGERAFRGCSSLTSITIPEGVTSIGDAAFSGCSSLTAITIPEGVTSIRDAAFSGCSSLTAITLPDGVTSIGGGAFRYCSSLAAIILPESVTRIGSDAFYNCSSLTSITLPEGVTSIGSDAFSGCSSLTSITIPEGVTSIGYWAFEGCIFASDNFINNSTCSSEDNWGASLFEREYDGMFIENNIVVDCRPNVTIATIPAGVTSIGSSAFSGCESLKEVTFGKGLKKIASGSFSGCSSIEKITIHATQPPTTDGYIFDDTVYENATLYVPQGSIAKYQVMTGWSGFYNITEMEDGTPNYLSIRQADNGEVGIAVDLGRSYKVRITPSTGWTIHSVTFNGKDMTAQLSADNTFTTPTLTASAVLNVAYVKEGTAINNANASRLSVRGHNGIISISGAAEGEAITIYTLDGAMVASEEATDDTTSVEVPTQQVYIVKVADAVVKIGM